MGTIRTDLVTEFVLYIYIATTTVSEGSNTQKGEEADDIMTAAKLRNLAKNIDRRAQNRSTRRLEGNLRYDTTGASDELETRSGLTRGNSGGEMDRELLGI